MDVNQFKQVLLNLINNALDASDPGGELVLETGMDDGWVKVAVSDQGPGISDENLPHIFEPFFTTKPEVKGTGLGLSVSHGIIVKHGGEIDVETHAGRGTKFSIEVPRASDRLQEPAPDG